MLVGLVLFCITELPYNAHSDWLKPPALSENKAQVDDGKLAFKFLLRNFDKCDPNYTFPVTQTHAMEMKILVCSEYACRETIVYNNSVKAVLYLSNKFCHI